MLKSIKSKLGVILLGAGLALGVTAGAVADDQDSGFLPDYSRLQEGQDAQGKTIRVWANPKFTPANYKAIILDPIRYYPEPKPNDSVSAGTLNDVLAYANSALKKSLSSGFKIVNSPGPGVARIRIAITGVGKSKEGLKPYQLIPIAFIFTAAKRAAEGAPYQGFVLVEAEATDSVTGELLGMRTRAGTGENMPQMKEGTQLTLQNLKPLIDQLTQNAFPNMAQYVQPMKK